MIYTMPRNEAKDFILQKFNDYYNHKIGWDQVNSIQINFIPLDLSEYKSIRDETKKWIDRIFTEEGTDNKGRYVLRGHTENVSSEIKVLNLCYGKNSRYNNFWGYNDEEKLIYKYCDGDTTLHLYTDQNEYLYDKEKNEEFYYNN